jgi:hypothetical protein
LHVITSAQQTDVGRDGDIHTIPPQTVGNGMVDMLIQVEASHSFNHILQACGKIGIHFS